MKKKGRLGLRSFAGLATFIAVAAVVVIGGTSSFANVNGAAFTTDNPGFLETGPYTDQACTNGPSHSSPSVNCNIYNDKRDVWINGGPSAGQNNLTDGTYFFVVLDPGGQRDPNDGSAGNLSSPNDAYTNRTFTVSGGHVSLYGGTHLFDTVSGGALGTLIQLAPYDDTANPGGVYILAICAVPDPVTGSPGVTPSDCKYDAFKVKEGATTPPAQDLDVQKGATPSFDREFSWTILKSVDQCGVNITTNVGGCNISGTTKTLTYTVVVTKGTGVDGNWKVTGTITVTNPNDYPITGVTVTDAVDGQPNGGNCVVTGGASHTLAANGVEGLSYTCTYGQAPAASTQTNRATVSWDASNALPNTSAEATAGIDWTNTKPTLIHNSVNVSDGITSTIPALPASGFDVGSPSGDFPSGSLSDSYTFVYTRALTVQHDCLTVNNTASFTVTDPDSDADDSGSSSVRARVCRLPAQTGALTMGFWQNKNGQGIITGGTSAGGVCNSGTWLRTFNPFADLSASATCSQVATYVLNVIKAAKCSSTDKTCNTMLKAQDLATSLDVYFSDPALGGNQIGKFNGKGNSQQPVGNFNVDLTQICNMIDGPSGSATCSGVYQNASSVFGNNSCLFVYKTSETTDILRYAASQSNVGGTSWYGQIKANQVLAKNVFDAINNTAALACP
jgi:hypothetical protein